MELEIPRTNAARSNALVVKAPRKVKHPRTGLAQSRLRIRGNYLGVYVNRPWHRVDTVHSLYALHTVTKPYVLYELQRGDDAEEIMMNQSHEGGHQPGKYDPG